MSRHARRWTIARRIQDRRPQPAHHRPRHRVLPSLDLSRVAAPVSARRHVNAATS